MQRIIINCWTVNEGPGKIYDGTEKEEKSGQKPEKPVIRWTG